ncbi:hypothetical protein [Methylobacterium sp. WSM2598]|uniref:hypothetical protein n=1 Tax=Methylobacterium sp. WSM2598 TaxID=398261 RepID=UPI000475E5F4|nr:hypothetical protein [Methylobacterium sp. WSM2598]
MADQQRCETECDHGPEERALRAEVAYCLLERAYQTLALAFERAAPGRFECLNRALMRDVVADLRDLQYKLPDGVAADTVLVEIAMELRETLRATEAIVLSDERRQ